MKGSEYEIKMLDLDGVKKLIQLAVSEGWNPGAHDADAFYAADPEGFVGVFDGNDLIGGGSVFSYSGKFGFMGLFIMKPEYRLKGIGRKLWFYRRDKLIQRLSPKAPIGMDGAVAMQPFYQKGGFSIAFRDVRHECMGRQFKIDNRISTINSENINNLQQYDSDIFGINRWHFLKHWLNIPGIKSFMFIEGEQLQGYALMRKCRVGYKICPLFANSIDIAEKLFQACLNDAIGDPVYIDIPYNNQQAIELVNKYKSSSVFECARMYYGTPPLLAWNKVYGITTFELG